MRNRAASSPTATASRAHSAQADPLDQPVTLPFSRRTGRRLAALAVLWVVYDQRNGIAALAADLFAALG